MLDTATLHQRLSRIKLLVLDVDGVMTDGSIIIDSNGVQTKQFFSQDGHGIKMLQQVGVEIMLLSARICKATAIRAKELGISHVFLGEEFKRTQLANHMKVHNLSAEMVAYIGDDLIDLPAMNLCGIAIAPANAVDEIKERADFVTTRSGGKGSIRECCDLLLQAQDKWHKFLGS